MRYIEYDSVSMSSRSSPVMNVLTSSSLICSVIRLSLPRARANSCSGCGWLRSLSNSTSSRVSARVSSALASSRSKNFASWLKYFWIGKHRLTRRNLRPTKHVRLSDLPLNLLTVARVRQQEAIVNCAGPNDTTITTWFNAKFMVSRLDRSHFKSASGNRTNEIRQICNR